MRFGDHDPLLFHIGTKGFYSKPLIFKIYGSQLNYIFLKKTIKKKELQEGPRPLIVMISGLDSQNKRNESSPAPYLRGTWRAGSRWMQMLLHPTTEIK